MRKLAETIGVCVVMITINLVAMAVAHPAWAALILSALLIWWVT